MAEALAHADCSKKLSGFKAVSILYKRKPKGYWSRGKEGKRKPKKGAKEDVKLAIYSLRRTTSTGKEKTSGQKEIA